MTAPKPLSCWKAAIFLLIWTAGITAVARVLPIWVTNAAIFGMLIAAGVLALMHRPGNQERAA